MSDAQRLGFRDPPDIVSMSCLTYMSRVMELRDLIAVFFGLVKSSTALSAKLSDDDIKDALQESGSRSIAFRYNYSTHRQIVNEIMLSRAIESFDLYLISILREIFISKPEMLKSEGKIEISDVIELQNFEDIVAKIAEKKLHDLAYKPLSDLREYINKTTGIEIFRTKQIFDIVLLASEIRNLIAHNDCCVNDIFRRRVQKSEQEYDVSDLGKLKISDEWLQNACYTLDGVVFDLDEAVCKKFDINKHNRMTTFFRRP